MEDYSQGCQMRTSNPAVLILLLPLILLGGCTIGSSPGFQLGVPYRAQDPASLDCGPASVQMWRAFDGLSEVSQAEIAQWMGGSTCGVSAQVIADAVNQFTNTYDAYWDFVAYFDYPEFMSRQITSLNNTQPVIAIIDFNHAGVVNGGAWSPTGTGLYRWDYTYFHDPLTGPNRQFTSSLWIDMNCPVGRVCEQIVSFSYSAAWGSNLSAFGSSVVDSSGCLAAGCGPENQEGP